jgi:hypothetical protein
VVIAISIWACGSVELEQGVTGFSTPATEESFLGFWLRMDRIRASRES